jgi:CRISPR/Cas system-associated exonuclease Cas4 (RecB family)
VKEMAQINRRHTITASEIGEFAYCPKAWYLKRCREVAQSPRLDDGVAFHETHEAGVSQSVRLNLTGMNLYVRHTKIWICEMRRLYRHRVGTIFQIQILVCR